MKVMLLSFVRGFVLLAAAALPTLEAVAQGPPGGNGTAQVPGTYSHAPAYYDEPFVGYQRQSALQSANQRNAAMTVLENNIGYQMRAPFGPQLSYQGIFGDRRGIEGNDYSVSGFLPWHIDPNRTVAFAVLRGTATDLGDFVGNFGVGSRMYLEELNRIIGFSLWYDIDDSHNQQYNRGGFQLEYLGRYLELRAGTDIVIDTNDQVLRAGFTDRDPFFRGNNVLFEFTTTGEFAYNQTYAEAGGPMPFLGRYGVNAYGGAYYLSHDNAKDSLGWSIRTSADLTRDVQVGMRHTNDDVFGHNTSVNVTLSFPNGGLKQVFRSPRTIVRGQSPNLRETNQVIQLRPGSVANLMRSRVVRDHRTPVHIDTMLSNVNAIDPVTGAPVCVVHVDPNASSLGTGTFADPFRTLEAARVANDGTCRIIRVVPRADGTGTNLGLADTFGLFTNQRLLSSSFEHQIETTRGLFALPGFTGSAPGPVVTNTMGGDLVDMDDNTEVSGFQLVGSATGNGIVGNPVDFNINRNDIRDALNGILLTDATGTGRMTENVVTNNVAHGAAIRNPNGGVLDLTMTDNELNNNGGDGGHLDVTGGALQGLIANNSGSGNTGNGFTINTNGSVVDFRDLTLGRRIVNNQFGGNMGDGFLVNSTGGSTVAMRFEDNDFGSNDSGAAGNMGIGWHYVADSGWHTIDVGGPSTTDGNRFMGNMDTAAQFDLSGTADMSLLFQNNEIGIMAAILDPGALIRSGFDGNILAANDDGSTGLVPIGFNANFFGTMFSDLFVNNNGNVTFNSALGTFTPFPIVSNGIPIIAPFFGDVDTRAGNVVTYGQGTVGSQSAFGVNYIDVRHFAASGATGGLPTNSFQLVLIDRSDIGAGDFDIEFNYERILWEAGEASGGDAAGLGGSAARAGFSNGTTNSFELAGSAVNGAFLDSGPAATSLIQNSINSPLLGRYLFEARNGQVGMGGGPPAAGPIDGLQINTADMAVVKQAVVDSNQIRGIVGTGVNVQADTGSTINNLRIDNNDIMGLGRDGIRLAADNVAVINLTSMMNNASSGHGQNGFVADATNGGTINISSAQGNNFSSNFGHGAHIRADGVSVVAGGLGVVGSGTNILNANGGYGINIEATNGGSILGPGGIGKFEIMNNQIGDVTLGNIMGGINALADATAPTTSTLNLSINRNSILNNVDAGIAYSLQGNSTGQLMIVANSIIDTIDDGTMTTPLSGQGVYVEVAGTSMLSNSMIDANTIFSNASHGIEGLIREDAVLTDIIIGNLDGDNDNGNIITENEGDGILWQRRDNGQVINASIIDNTLTNNVNGLNLISSNASQIDTYTINDNDISMNTANGVRLRVEADADLRANMDNNIISMNMGDGINTSESVNAPTDSRSIRGTWSNNEITTNGGFGIDLGANTVGLLIGGVGAGNLIDSNGSTGIRIGSSGTLTISDNMITNNNATNAADPFTTVGGIDLNGTTFNTVVIARNMITNNFGTGVRLANLTGPFGVDVTLTGNLIDSNTGDGVEITGNNSMNTMTITSSQNMISRNLGRGVDILNQGDSSTNASFNLDMITSNELEGFYVVNTASTTQNQSDAATDPLAADGLVTAIPLLNLALTNSQVNFNGNSSTFSGAGFALRVGTSDGGSTDFTDPGGFASDGRGGVIANVSNNVFSGNFGDDVIFESFVSTVDPADSAGSWDTAPNPDEFELTTYASDPLARLDLTFVGNTGNSANVARAGASYNNDEDEFKSRDTTQAPPGPFASGTRERNAQRLAAREVNAFGDFTAPGLTIIGVDGSSDNFLYPGVSGTSTFRRTAASNTAGFVTADSFNDLIMLGTGVGELPFGWSIMP